MKDERLSDSAFAERVAAPMRDAVHTAPGFEARVMAAVAAAAATDAPAVRSGATVAGSWWIRPRTLRLSPLGGLLLAAGFAGVVGLGTLRFAAWGLDPSSGAGKAAVATVPVHDTVQVVRFVFVDGDASRVSVVGDFNGWNPVATPLAADGQPGMWAVSVALSAGRHEYAFVVNGGQWLADPFAARRADEFAVESSIITVGEGGR